MGNWFKKSVFTIVGLGFIGLLMIGILNLIVIYVGSRDNYSVNNAPNADVALILGAKVFKNGDLAPVLEDRVLTGVELYKLGKVKRLLMSGDNSTIQYNEVEAMKQYAIKHGVKSEDIFTDHAGFSTYDSMYRARDIFQVKNVIIVTQQGHLMRALFLAKALGLDAAGVDSKKRPYVDDKSQVKREILARVKAVGQIIIKDKPKYLGPVIPIMGEPQKDNI